MKKSFKFLTFFAAAMMVAGTFTGCGSDGDGDNNGGNTPPPTPGGDTSIADMEWVVPEFANGGDVIEGGNASIEIIKQSYPNRYFSAPDPGHSAYFNYQSCCINWSEPYSDEAALLKISKAKQLEIIAEAKEKSFQDNPKVYVISGRCVATMNTKYCAIVYKGTQSAPVEVTRGKWTSPKLTMGDKGANWAYKRFMLETPVEITGAEDLYVGVMAKTTSSPDDYTPFCFIGNSEVALTDDAGTVWPAFPGRDAEFPSYGLVPSVEKYLQEINDPEETVRWNWVQTENRGSFNWCVAAEFGVTEEAEEDNLL